MKPSLGLKFFVISFKYFCAFSKVQFFSNTLLFISTFSLFVIIKYASIIVGDRDYPLTQCTNTFLP